MVTDCDYETLNKAFLEMSNKYATKCDLERSLITRMADMKRSFQAREQELEDVIKALQRRIGGCGCKE